MPFSRIIHNGESVTANGAPYNYHGFVLLFNTYWFLYSMKWEVNEYFQFMCGNAKAAAMWPRKPDSVIPISQYWNVEIFFDLLKLGKNGGDAKSVASEGRRPEVVLLSRYLTLTSSWWLIVIFHLSVTVKKFKQVFFYPRKVSGISSWGMRGKFDSKNIIW